MLDVDGALASVLAAVKPLEAVSLPLIDALGHVLASDVIARDRVPPFRNSAMDGFAVRAVDTKAATWTQPISLRVTGEAAAGQDQVGNVNTGEAIRIMTGAPMPAGADAVVRFEETDAGGKSGSDSEALVRVFHPARPLDNVREAGEDIASGDRIAEKGCELRPATLGLLASVGHAEVTVHRAPTVAILSTGNEVLSPGQELAPGKIRDSNAYVLAAMARRWGAAVQMLGVARDTVEDLTSRLDAAAEADFIVTSGGVSIGDYDFVKDVLRAEGEIGIWQVRMKPGKPLAFGQLRGRPLLGLPGNPVAAAVSFILFGRPAIRRMMGFADLEPETVEVLAADRIDNRGQRRHYVRVRLRRHGQSALTAHVVGEQGAGILSSLAAADALLVVPEELEQVAPGTSLNAILLDR
jgi:molybdopterin molybdotransferase